MKVLNLLFGVLALTRADNEPAKKTLTVKAPYRHRVSKNIMKRVFHARDQEIFNMFQDAPLNTTGGSPFSGLNVKLSPQTGEVKDFDFDFSLETDDLSVSSSGIKFEGKGEYNGN